ncbi:hypothetical protein IC232_23420 [Microvirga sp. BT688]|uniref:DUF6894 family protein n=1 Tax=Microvirga sp. TaxID=1873136 RepID=UPI001682F901|nr:hypothetical protein [Microvirga sp.]MBD2749632.1 hypothetical protein [Microvirga sp.]
MFYHFNLTDGDEVIRDEVGVRVPGIDVAVTSATEVIAELKQEDPSHSDEWHDWRLEIADPSGLVVRTIPLKPKARLHCT